MLTPTGTSIFIGIAMKNELPEKSFAFFLIRKGEGMGWHTKGSKQPTCI
jgi:hypothetical protein